MQRAHDALANVPLDGQGNFLQLVVLEKYGRTRKVRDIFVCTRKLALGILKYF